VEKEDVKVTIKFDEEDLQSIMDGLHAMADEIQYLREVLERLQEEASGVASGGEVH
tara:strand:- start:247 stop:414 length:168 start_codon:yes stop_codon:yes gene_type:complete